ncbi:PKD domain-containing protein [bacterium]|nr:PKD domain-containing protein [bacterium]
MRRLLVLGLLILLAMVCLAAPGCGSRQSGGAGIPVMPSGTEAPSPAELEALLAAELARLGVDPAKAAAAAPQGETNRVFNLEAAVVDPDGHGGGFPSEIILAWTERCVGDYNQDGLVGVSDLTPLGQQYLETVDYGPADYRFGIPYWPLGFPTDDGGAGVGNPPLDGSPADRWRLARVDGNGDGLINVSDITPIGQHWKERLDGYRVYRKCAGEQGYMLVKNQDDPALPYTVPRQLGFPAGATEPDPRRPVHYVFHDYYGEQPLGMWEYFVVPYDAESDQEGVRSTPALVYVLNGGGGTLPPIASLTVDVDHGVLPLTVTFDASNSWDADGNILKYEWDTDNDPATFEWDSQTDPSLPGITYHTSGVHDQWVRVTDNDGLTATACAKVAVADTGGNLPPLAKVAGTPARSEVPRQVTWDASASLDYDGSIVKYEWDLDDNPIDFEQDTGTTPTLVITYDQPYQHFQYVRVTDNTGASDIAFGSVITSAGLNLAPFGVITAGVTEGEAPFTVEFDAGQSYDLDGTIQQYEWDFDSDNITDLSSQSPIAQFVYITPGIFTATLTVIDDQGARGQAYQNAWVHGWRTIRVDAGPYIGLDVSLALIAGRPAIAYSLNDFGNDMELRYIRAAEGCGDYWPASPVVVYDGGNQYLVGTSLSLAEVNGRPAIAYHDASAGMLLYRRAGDAEGASWPAQLNVLDGGGAAMAGDGCSLAVIGGLPAVSYRHMTLDYLRYIRALDLDGTVWGAPVAVNANAGSGAYSLLLEGTTSKTVPMIAHYNHAISQLLFECSDDAIGVTWGATVGISNSGSCYDSVAFALVDGLPTLAYFGLSQFGATGLNYIRGTDGVFSGGTARQLVSGNENGMRPCLAEVYYKPAVAYKYRPLGHPDRLMYIEATDKVGDTWGAVETVDIANSIGPYLSMIEVNDQPAIAYTNDTPGELWYAIRH